MSAQLHTVPIDCGYLYAEERGEGEAVIFIHGFGLDSDIWDRQFYEFFKKTRMIR